LTFEKKKKKMMKKKSSPLSFFLNSRTPHDATHAHAREEVRAAYILHVVLSLNVSRFSTL
jgi:hypothetical protein